MFFRPRKKRKIEQISHLHLDDKESNVPVQAMELDLSKFRDYIEIDGTDLAQVEPLNKLFSSEEKYANRLVSLNLHSHPFLKTPAEVDAIAEGFGHFQFLEELNVGFTTITEKVMVALQTLPFLETLNLDNTHISLWFIGLLLKFPALTNVSLRANSLKNEDATLLAANTKLLRVNLQFNEIEDKGAEALLSHSSITDLNMAKNQLKGLCFAKLQQNQTLIKLNVEDNPIEEKHFPLLRSNASISSLYLSGQLFHPTNITTPLTFLDFTAMQNLQSLALSNNAITETGFITLLENNKTITDLNVSYNQITGTTWPNRLAQDKKIVSLDMFRNPVQINDNSFINMLRTNTTLTHLDVCQDSGGASNDFLEAVCSNYSLTRVDVRIISTEENQNLIARFHQKLNQNKIIQQRNRYNWAGVAMLMGVYRAPQHYQNSIFPLINPISEAADMSLPIEDANRPRRFIS